MKVLVTGSHGLVGSKLSQLLATQGHTVKRLVRSNPAAGDVLWDPTSNRIDKEQLEGFDGVVHLAGENIAAGRWSAAQKEKIRSSRINGTKLLCEALSALKSPPTVLVSASAIGYYGDRGDEVLTEESSMGSGFLAEVCRDWENATDTARQRGIRTVNLRIGVILSLAGGALTKMLPPFQLGLGGRLGSGNQWMSWIALDDIAGIIVHALQSGQLSGPVNAVSPNAVTNAEFTKALGKALHRPTVFPVPGFAMHLLLGDMADELLLSSQRVVPDKLTASGYSFQQPHVEPLLSQLFKS